MMDPALAYGLAAISEMPFPDYVRISLNVAQGLREATIGRLIQKV